MWLRPKGHLDDFSHGLRCRPMEMMEVVLKRIEAYDGMDRHRRDLFLSGMTFATFNLEMGHGLVKHRCIN
jgi:hypothetical protein